MHSSEVFNMSAYYSPGTLNHYPKKESYESTCKVVKLNLAKTKLCVMYSQGKCFKGERCAFAHGASDLQEPPNFYKTSLCLFHMSGKKCIYKEKCKFAHGESELRLKPILCSQQINSNKCISDTFSNSFISDARTEMFEEKQKEMHDFLKNDSFSKHLSIMKGIMNFKTLATMKIADS